MDFYPSAGHEDDSAHGTDHQGDHNGDGHPVQQQPQARPHAGPLHRRRFRLAALLHGRADDVGPRLRSAQAFGVSAQSASLPFSA